MAAKGYTTKERVENYMLIDIDPQWDEQIDDWIQVAEKIIDQETGRDFAVAADPAAPEDRKYDGNDSNDLRIDATIEVNSVKLSPTSGAVAADQYDLYPTLGATKNKIKMLYQKFPKGFQNIVVNANWGYEETPKDIEMAATIIVAGIINAQWSQGGDISSVTIGGYSVTYKTAKQAQDFAGVQDILDRNKRYTF